MSAILNPYISFRGKARAALEFYHGVFGGDLTISTFDDFGNPMGAGIGDQVMHGMLTGENGLVIMAADTPESMNVTFGNNISVSLSGDDEDALRGYFTKLSEGATIREQLTKAPWGDVFGMLTDQFGVEWVVNIAAGNS